MPEVMFNNTLIKVGPTDLGEWLHDSVKPYDHEASLDTEASGRHVDGNWATDAAKCEPEARVSIVSLSWRAGKSLHELAIPFDQGWIGGKKGRYIKKITKKTPVLGWQTLPHVEHCELSKLEVIDEHARVGNMPAMCTCAPWNFGVQGWIDLCDFLRTGRIERINYFNAKYDQWIMLAGLRNGAHVPCRVECRGWQHGAGCLNAGIDLSAKLGVDVMIREGITDPATPDSLDNCARKFFGETKDRGIEEGLKENGVGLGKRYDLVDWRKYAAKYAAKDASLTHRAVERERAQDAAGELDERDYPIIAREHKKINVLFGMERRGVGFNAPLCAEQAVKMHEEIAKLIGQLPFKDTNNAAAEWFFAPGRALPVKLTEGGKPSCDAEVVARLTKERGEVGEVAKLWQHIANMKSVCSKWYDAWPHRAGMDGRLRTNFWQCAVESDRKDQRSGGAISGRLSADRVQLQGIPQAWRIPKGIVGIKDLFQPAPGCSVLEFDASNAEVRETARLTSCQALADIINSGVNIHSANTVNIFGAYMAASWEEHFGEPWNPLMPHNAFVSADGEGFTTIASEAKLDSDGDPIYVLSKHPEWKKIRTAMKRGIFGTIYASGVRTLKSQIDNDLKDDIPERQIAGFQNALNSAYPEIKRTSKAAERRVDVAAGGPGFVRLISGRRRVFGWGERTYKALNAIVQGSVAEQMSDLMISIDERWPGMLINQVHDSVWLEIPNELIDEVSAWVKAEGKRIFEANNEGRKVKVVFKFDSKVLCSA